VKLALQHGCPLVPCFSFGLRQSFDFIGTSNSTIFAIGRAVGGLPLLFFGLFGLPFGPPKPCQYTNIIGKPLSIPRIEQPSQEDIDKHHALFIEALRALFEATKHEYGEPNISLRIV
jgi:2-acylglycerol O-acyltransferase 2